VASAAATSVRVNVLLCTVFLPNRGGVEAVGVGAEGAPAPHGVRELGR
jgi:hypothetical protein